MCLIFCLVITAVSWSQDLFIALGGEITTSPGGVLYAGNDVTIDSGGSLTTISNEDASGSFIVNGNSTGQIVYKRYVTSSGDPAVDADWHLVSAPVMNQSIPDFVNDTGNEVFHNSVSNNYGVSYYNNTNSINKRWTYHNTAPTLENQEILTKFTKGQGYSMIRSSNGYYTFTGEVANSDVGVQIPFNKSGTHFWSCIGNPFPSFLPANESANATENVLKDNINKLDPNFASFYVWNGVDYDPIRNSDPAFQLSPGQSFMVRAKSLSEPQFVFKKNLQNHNGGTTTFYRSSSSEPTIVVHLTNGAVNKTTKIEFLDIATMGLDPGYDAGAYKDGASSFYLHTHLVSDSQGVDFTIQTLPTSALDRPVAIPLSINAAIKERLTFSVVANNISDGVAVYLEDALNNTFTNLRDTPLEIITTSPLQGIGRFYIHTSSSPLNVENKQVDHILNVYKTANRTLKILGLNAQGNASLKIYNINGREVLTKSFVAQRIKEISLPGSLSTGVYVVRVVSEDGDFLHKKIRIE